MRMRVTGEYVSPNGWSHDYTVEDDRHIKFNVRYYSQDHKFPNVSYYHGANVPHPSLADSIIEFMENYLALKESSQ